MNDTDKDNKSRNREIAENEAERQTTGDIRVSAWAVAIAVIIALAGIGWVLLHNK
jgi:uncharacterized protein HemX